MVDALLDILGEYVLLNGEGLGQVNFPWIAGAVILIIFIWFTCKIILRIFDWGTHR